MWLPEESRCHVTCDLLETTFATTTDHGDTREENQVEQQLVWLFGQTQLNTWDKRFVTMRLSKTIDSFQGRLESNKQSIMLRMVRELIYWFYTCQLFLRYKREIFILGVLGFLKTTRSFPKSSEDVRSLPKSAKGELAPSAFHFKNQRSRGRYCHLLILHMVFVPYMGLS